MAHGTRCNNAVQVFSFLRYHPAMGRRLLVPDVYSIEVSWLAKLVGRVHVDRRITPEERSKVQASAVEIQRVLQQISPHPKTGPGKRSE